MKILLIDEKMSELLGSIFDSALKLEGMKLYHKINSVISQIKEQDDQHNSAQ